jgi:hypothetical protein
MRTKNLKDIVKHTFVGYGSLTFTMCKERKQEELVNHAQNILTSSRGARIYEVIEGIQSPYTLIAYRRDFKHFLDCIKIHDLQVLLDYSPKVIESFIIFIIDYHTSSPFRVIKANVYKGSSCRNPSFLRYERVSHIDSKQKQVQKIPAA